MHAVHFAAVVAQEVHGGHMMRRRGRPAGHGRQGAFVLFDVLLGGLMPSPQGRGHSLIEYGRFHGRSHLFQFKRSLSKTYHFRTSNLKLRDWQRGLVTCVTRA